MQACEEAGIHVPVVGLDGIAEVMKLIKDGRMLATASFTPEWQAGFAVVKAYDVEHGWKPSPLETMMFTGTIIVTKDNVDTYQKFLAAVHYHRIGKKSRMSCIPTIGTSRMPFGRPIPRCCGSAQT